MPTIETIDRDALETVAGGSTVTSRSSSTDQLQLMLGQITSSISDLTNNNKNQLDPMMMIRMKAQKPNTTSTSPSRWNSPA